ncbi:uncharacterized protein [Typha angustifolia]|uniref:uncharacterized protein n=1 Tax=Typha angustifolia TaxID=59011 RepID=UPI003C2C924F
MKPSPVAAAVMVQKVFRGFLVRKNVEFVRKLAAEADNIESVIAASAATIWYDAKERVCVGEMLMGLLLLLDSARGVRELRKKVIRKVIALQEIVDSISAAAEVERFRGDTGMDGGFDAMVRGEGFKMDCVEESIDSARIGVEHVEERIDSAQIEVEDVKETIDSISEVEEGPREDIARDGDPDYGNRGKVGEEGLEIGNVEETTNTPQIENENLPEIQNWTTNFKDWVMVDSVVEGRHNASTEIEVEMETMETEETVEKLELAEDFSKEVPEKIGKTQEAPILRDLLDKMIVENARLEGWVAELCMSSAQQSSLMERLVERVEQLEQAVQRLEKKTEEAWRQG